MATTTTAAPAAALGTEAPALVAAALGTSRTEAPAEPAATILDVEKGVEAPAEVAPVTGTPADDQFFAVADVVLRFLLFAAALVVVVVLATAKQTKNVSVPGKFENSPSLIYFLAAYSVAGLYSVITYVLSLYAILKPGFLPEVLSQFVIFDVILLGIIAAATGAASTFGYIGLKGDSHLGWKEVCNTYDVFCKHIGAAFGVSVFACIVLAALVLFTLFALLKKVPK